MRQYRITRSILVLLWCATPATPAPSGERTPFPPIPGWTLTVDTTVYTPRNLWDFIDGAAEAFLSYGFEDLRIGDYMAEDSLAVRVEAYRHASPTMAFGIYAAERKADYHFIEIGTEGYQADGVLNFLSGEYYLKLSTHGSGRRAAMALRSIAERVAGNLDRPREWPAGLRLLPESGRRPHTEGFVAADFLGYTFFRNVFTARYGEGAGFLLFVTPLSPGPQAEETLRAYGAATGKPEVRNGGLRFADPDNGPVTLVRSDSLLFGLVDAPADSVEARYISLIHVRNR